MTVITWCWEKLRCAYAACKPVICCSGGIVEMDDHQDHVYHVDDLPSRAGEQTPSVQLQTARAQLSPQRRRPDVQPMGMRRLADPEKVAAVFKACKELQVPIGENRFEDGYNDGGGPAPETRKKTVPTEPQKKNTDNTDPRRR